MDRERLAQVAELLERLAMDRSLLDDMAAEDRERLLRAIDLANNPDNRTRRRWLKAKAREQREARVRKDDAVLHATGIRTLRRKPVFTTPNVFPPSANLQPPTPNSQDGPLESWKLDVGSSEDLQHCYVCKQKYTEIHHFYDQLCQSCAEVNYGKRSELTDLRGRVALLTGGRVKIGYQAGLKLLRSGVHLIVTTRFPRDGASRFAQEPDFDDWKDRLEIFGLDLRHTPSVEAFCHEMLTTRRRLDFIINNACQTVRRPPDFYAHMMAREEAAMLGAGGAGKAGRELSLVKAFQPVQPFSPLQPGASARLSQVALLPEDAPGRVDLFPAGQLDQDLQQIDLRGRNSWRLLLHEVSSVELLEVHLVNAVAPFIINARLKALMLRTPERDKHIVNVSAMEGQFYRNFKTTRHPHTNMAKAALNMMTRTSAADYHGDGIHMNSVDTGWVTDEDPAEIAARKTTEQRFHPPLDIVDGGARIVDPIVTGFNTGNHVWGQFLKDYQPTDW